MHMELLDLKTQYYTIHLIQHIPVAVELSFLHKEVSYCSICAMHTQFCYKLKHAGGGAGSKEMGG